MLGRGRDGWGGRRADRTEVVVEREADEVLQLRDRLGDLRG